MRNSLPCSTNQTEFVRALKAAEYALLALLLAATPAIGGPKSSAALEREVRAAFPKLSEPDVTALTAALADLPDGTELRFSTDPSLGTVAFPVSTGTQAAAALTPDPDQVIDPDRITLVPTGDSGRLKPQQVTPVHALDGLTPVLPDQRVDQFARSACGAAIAGFRADIQASQFGATGYNMVAARLRSVPELISTINQFDTSCYQPIAVPTTTQTGPAVEDLGDVLRGAAILVTTDDAPWCMATHVGNGRFITADHCIDGSVGAPNELRLLMLATPDQRFGVEVIRRRPQDDSAIIKPVEMRGHIPPIPSIAIASTVEVGEEAAIIGHFLFQSPEAWLPTGVTPDWRKGVRVNRGASSGCMIIGVGPSGLAQTAARIAHSCQTTQGFSGGPLLVRRQDTQGASVWQLAAVHSGARCTGRPACDDRTGVPQGTGNLAMAVMPDLLAAALEPRTPSAAQNAGSFSP